ncbi:hypothetical protein TNCV_3780971 [Trichonephila clavipes]|nr:hypothetical protein TNCV_3780971 [Trichonephila clavipes]
METSEAFLCLVGTEKRELVGMVSVLILGSIDRNIRKRKKTCFCRASTHQQGQLTIPGVQPKYNMRVRRIQRVICSHASPKRPARLTGAGSLPSTAKRGPKRTQKVSPGHNFLLTGCRTRKTFWSANQQC